MPIVTHVPESELARWRAAGLIVGEQGCGPLGGVADVEPGRGVSKYRNKKTEIDGRTFDSKKEANRYLDLREQQRAGHVQELACQVSIPLIVNEVKIGHYVADFVYWRGGKMVIEDVKGMRTDVYKLKRKILAANGVIISEV